jgi:MOSC domain-containing protein YiiM
MRVELICVATTEAGPVTTVESVSAVAGKGIVGDRNFEKRKYPGQNITLVEAEEIERFNAETGAALALSATRRNLVTRGVRLNALVGREFRIGSVALRGVELCEPCATLGRNLAHGALAAPAIVKALVHRCGLRADVLTSGIIACGDDIAV